MLRTFTIAALIGAAISCSPEKSGDNGKTLEVDPQDYGNQVLLTTSVGEIIIELDPEMAPLTVANFLNYVTQGHYDGTLFHLVIDGYMIGAGEVAEDFVEKPGGEPVRSESRNGLKNDRGTIAMMRKPDPHSATAAFFINLNDNMALNYPQPDGYGYTVFGRVTSGMETVDQIANTETAILPLTLLNPDTGEAESREVADVPTQPIAILSARRIPK
ncbi:peptidylprolyl isomerase [Haloferula sp.]|uniref:peptidylprolyl isomerase n=1 Tax=Haloferula sp. TaxID=2497595 RepID=UPI003C76EBD6